MPNTNRNRADTGIMLDWNEIPDSGQVPTGYFQVAVDSLEASFSRAKHHLMMKATYIVAEPREFANFYLYDYFMIGSDEDPNGQDKDARKRSIGLQRLKGLFKALGIEMDGSLDKCCEIAEGQAVMLKMGMQKNKDTGEERNQVNKYMALGEREPGLDDSDKGGKSSTLKHTPGHALDDAGDDDPAPTASSNGKPATKPATAAAAPKTAAKTAAPKTAPKAAAPVAEEDEPTETVEEETAETAAPEDEPAAPPPAAVKKKAASAEPELECPLCNEKFRKSQLQKHMLICEKGSE